jgi:uncharacterized protein
VLWALSAIEVLVVGALVVSSLTGPGGSAPLPSSHVDSLAAPGYFASMLDRLGEWPMHTMTVLPFIMITWLGMWATRRRILEEPAQHKSLLTWTAVLGLGVAIAGGLPAALISAGWLHVDGTTASLTVLLHGATPAPDRAPVRQPHAARLLDKRQQAGPAETILRRLTYGPRS